MKIVKLPPQLNFRHDIEIKDGVPYLTVRYRPFPVTQEERK